MTTWILVSITLLFLAAGARLWVARLRAERIAAQRRVEKPNSHYSSELVRHQRDRERWRRVDLEKLHPINREEVERLLGVVETKGPDVLSPRDRLFLDNMTRLSFGS